MTKPPVRVAVLVSGGGTNLQALLDAFHTSSIVRIARVISNRAQAGALERARRAGVPTVMLRDPGDAAELLAALGDAQLVVLAGYLKLVPAPVVSRFRGRMINIHPALLPDFGGAGMYGHRVHAAVLASGATESGVTVHLVDEEVDHGPIVLQEPVAILPGDDERTLHERVKEVEHRLFPRAAALLAEGKLKIEGRRVHILDQAVDGP